jgi:hypothetical protein
VLRDGVAKLLREAKGLEGADEGVTRLYPLIAVMIIPHCCRSLLLLFFTIAVLFYCRSLSVSFPIAAVLLVLFID